MAITRHRVVSLFPFLLCGVQHDRGGNRLPLKSSSSAANNPTAPGETRRAVTWLHGVLNLENRDFHA